MKNLSSRSCDETWVIAKNYGQRKFVTDKNSTLSLPLSCLASVPLLVNWEVK